MKQNAKRSVVILVIICVSIVVGLVTNGIWTWVERKTHPQDYNELIRTYSEQYNVPTDLVYAVIKVESNFDPSARSSAQAIGLMQMVPSTFAMLTGTDYLNEHLVDGEAYLTLRRELNSGTLSTAEELIKRPQAEWIEAQIKQLLQEPEISIRYGVYYLQYLQQKFLNWDTTLAAYNGGEGNVSKWLNDPACSDGQGNLTHIPFEETREYVKKVNHAMDTYKKLYH